jgi:hypothetical protein
MTPTIILTLNAEQWNEIHAGLGERPLKSAGPVRAECERQINEQLQAAALLQQTAKPNAPQGQAS